MKLKHIFTAVAAALVLAVGCEKETVNQLAEVQVSSSYVAINQNGGAAAITVTANDSWTISDVPEWLSVSPASGSAGQLTVNFSAEGTLDGRTEEIHLNCGGKVQNIIVIQGLPVISPATCAEIIAGPEKQYQVTGICTKIANTQYGNWYINDGTGEVYVYGTVDATGSYNWAKFGIEVGDEVTVAGPKQLYGTTVELVDATFISVNKSLIKVASMDPENGVVATKGGDIAITLENKGKGLDFEVPLEYPWISIKSISGNTVKLHIEENLAGPRNATLVFKTTDGKKEYSAETEISQLGASGSKELPFTVAEAIAYCNTLSGETTTDFYVKGIVSQIASKGEFGSYGNGTFFISDDGEYHNDKTLDFEAYRVLWLGNEKWVEGNAQIAVGAEVVLCGKLTIYSGTAETSQNKAYVYKINGVQDEEEGIGTLEAPFTAVGAIAACQSAPASDVFISGKVSKIVDQFSEKYGNGTFWISDDGEYHSDKALDFEAYRVLWLDNQKWVASNPTVAEGDKVVLKGKVTLYNGTAETSSGKAYVYSIEK